MRFITSQPNLTGTAGKFLAEGSNTRGGSNGYDLGASISASIVQNLQAMQLSAEHRRDGGYIDHVSQFTGETLTSDTNSTDNTTPHASFLWKPSEQTAVTLACLYTLTENSDADAYWENIPSYVGLPITEEGPTSYGPLHPVWPVQKRLEHRRRQKFLHLGLTTSR